jgi:hypothetical protein
MKKDLHQTIPNRNTDFSTSRDRQKLAARHLAALAGQRDIRQTRFIFSAFHDRDKSQKPWQRYCTLRQVLPDIDRLQARGYGIFVAVNGSRNGRRKGSDINRTRAAWADFDAPMVGTFQLEPSLKIQTGPGKGHAYWCIDQADAVAPHDGEQINRQIAATHGADPNACDRSRVLRLAGTYHLKADPYLVRIVEATGALYGRAELMKAYPPPKPKPRPKIDLTPIKHGDKYVAAAIEGECKLLASAGQGGRNHALNRAAFSLAQLGLAISEVANALGPVALGIGLDRSEAWRTIKSGAKAGAQHPREIGGEA